MHRVSLYGWRDDLDGVSSTTWTCCVYVQYLRGAAASAVFGRDPFNGGIFSSAISNGWCGADAAAATCQTRCAPIQDPAVERAPVPEAAPAHRTPRTTPQGKYRRGVRRAPAVRNLWSDRIAPRATVASVPLRPTSLPPAVLQRNVQCVRYRDRAVARAVGT
jgi:hypothetical protein